MKLPRTELLRMARCGAADGHDDNWHAAMMKNAAQKARDRLKEIENNFVPKP